MWIPAKTFELFHISKQSVDSLREELSAVRAERDLLKLQVAASQNHFDWLRIRTNQLEIERAGLIEKAYGIKVPVPEVVRKTAPTDFINQFSFDDMGEDAAKALGLPTYSSPFGS